MAKESFSSPMTPDVTGINGGNPRRNSLAGSANGREQSLSLYRRASIGACHDFCKPGKKHESEPKARLPFPTTIMKKPLDQPNLFDSSDSPQRQKISAIRSKSVPNSRTHQVNKVRTSTDSPDGSNSTVRKVLSIKEKASSVVKLGTKYSPNSRSHSYDTSVIINLEVPMNSSDGKPLRKPKSSPRLKSGPSDASNVMQQDGSSPSGRVHVSSKKVPSNANEKSFSKRPIPLSTKSRTEKLLPDVLSEGLSVQRRSGFSDIKTRNTTATSKVALEEVSAIPRASLSRRASLSGAISITARKNRNLKVVLPLKNQNEVESAKTEQLLDEHVGSNSDTLEEKTLYVIKLESENVMLESDKNENCAVEVSPPVQDESEYAVTEPNHDSDSAYNEDRTIKMEETDISEGENGGIPRKDGIVFSNANDCRSVHSDNNGPWQLTFRQGSVLEENQNNITEGRRTFTRRGVDSDQNDNELGEGKVVLRHQDVLGKQDGQGLFNIIIKETANKLVETRKSKVKALVGAFETVISLQDSKPSSNTVSE